MSGFLSQFDSLDTVDQAGLTQRWLTAEPFKLFAELRTNRPILVTPIGVLVSRFDDVQEVLSRGVELTVRPYAEKMERVTGPFILGMNDTSRYRKEASIMRLAFLEPKGPDLASRFTNWAREGIANGQVAGRLDIVTHVTRAVPTRFVEEYVGVQGPDRKALQHWARIIFRDIFLNVADDEQIRDQADAAAKEMRTYLDRLIAEQAEHADGSTVVARILRMRSTPETVMEKEVIRHNLLGMIVGIIDTTSKAAAYAIDWLLDHPSAFRQATEAVETGDDHLLTHCVLEAMRFKPQSTALLRLCESKTILAETKPWRTTISPGMRVYAATSSAMFDAEAVPAPDEFRTNRPETSYLHFGYGQHVCFGRYINLIQIREIVRSLLLLPNVRKHSPLQHEGPFPSQLMIEFDEE